MERNSVAKNTQCTSTVTTWLYFEYIMLSERSQSQNATYRVTPFIRNIQNKKIQRQKIDQWFTGGMNGEWLLLNMMFLFTMMEMFWNSIVVMGYSTLNIPRPTELYIFKGWISYYVNCISILKTQRKLCSLIGELQRNCCQSSIKL